MIRRPPRSTQSRSSAASDVYKRQFQYLITDPVSRECLVVDPAWDVQGLVSYTHSLDLTIKGAVLTHYHIDHCGGSAPGPVPPIVVEGVCTLVENNPTPVQIWVNRLDFDKAHRQTGAKLSSMFRTYDDDQLLVGNKSVRLLHTPGHTPGSQCVQVGASTLITGDTLFVGGCGRVDQEDSDVTALYDSLNKLREFPDDTVIMPGHNAERPHTWMRDAKQHNEVLNAALTSYQAWTQFWSSQS
eukprot:TRINITY_DN4035_c0_g2_i1.p1 TRINITY_DN4035_c0_g2~~TRINITY_DN4035_c0_g2_i1.p1  ORF type:complete len:242 (+),score=52.69 TRINITY_DN4035_c0_g2_i1:123-848(+)